MIGCIQKSLASDDDMKKIHEFARRELMPQEVYTFNVDLCNNDIDRDFEKVSFLTLYQLKDMIVDNR